MSVGLGEAYATLLAENNRLRAEVERLRQELATARKDALEEAAKVCERHYESDVGARIAADKIRALAQNDRT